MAAIQNKKLGRLPAKRNDKTLYFSKYLTSALPAIPDSYSWIDLDRVTDWGMMVNDRVGDCVWAGWGHLIMARTAASGQMFVPKDTDILAAYAGCTGFDPATGANDNGTDELSSCEYMQKTGIAGHKTGAYVSINTANIQEVKAAIYLFGGSLLGVELPLYAQGQNAWDAPVNPSDPNAAPGSWGGHGIAGLSYDANGINVITWGEALNVEWSFFAKYFDEAWADISPDYISGAKPSPNGFDMTALTNDLNCL